MPKLTVSDVQTHGRTDGLTLNVEKLELFHSIFNFDYTQENEHPVICIADIIR